MKPMEPDLKQKNYPIYPYCFSGIKTCKHCGKEIPKERRSNAVYCSEHCQRKAWTNHNKIKEMNKRMNNLRAKIVLAYDCKCAICGWKINSQTSSGCAVHHINPVCKGGNDNWNNLILLCPNHHYMADHGILKKEELKKHIIPYSAYIQRVIECKAKCADAIAERIF